MKRHHRTVIAVLLWLAAWGVFVALPQRGSSKGVARSVREILSRSSEQRPEEVVEALVRLGPDAQEPLFALLIAEEGDVSPERRELVARALVAHGPSELARFLETAANGVDEHVRLVALELLGRCATVAQVQMLVLLATTDAATETPDPLALALRHSLALTLVRDPRAVRELYGCWNRTREHRADLIAAVGESESPAGLEFLAWTAEHPEGLDRAVAKELLRLVPHVDPLAAREDLEELVALLESEDNACLQTASIALARLGVEAAIPAWIELLDHETRGVRERALASLVEVTGLSLGSTSERWQAWHDSELVWFAERAELVFAELEAEDAGRVLEALREIARRRLSRDELAGEVLFLLDHPDPSIRLCACRVLEGLASRVALESLLQALEDDDPTVARGAWTALQRCSGLELPFDPAAWHAGLARP